MRLRVLARKNPVERMISSTFSGSGPSQRGGIRIGRKESGRHHVDPRVGALRRQDGGRQELEGVLVLEGAEFPRRAGILLTARRSPPRATRPSAFWTSHPLNVPG